MPQFFDDQSRIVAWYGDINLIACFRDQCESVHQLGRTVPPEDNMMHHAYIVFFLFCLLTFGFS
jgi:hypothetical protein